RACRFSAAARRAWCPFEPFRFPLGGLLCRGWFYVATELLSHRRENFFGESVLLARAETRKQRGGEHVHGHGFIDGCLDGPASLAGILHEPAVLGKSRILNQCHGREIEQPGTDYAAATPHFSDVGQIQIVAMVF